MRALTGTQSLLAWLLWALQLLRVCGPASGGLCEGSETAHKPPESLSALAEPALAACCALRLLLQLLSWSSVGAPLGACWLLYPFQLCSWLLDSGAVASSRDCLWQLQLPARQSALGWHQSRMHRNHRLPPAGALPHRLCAAARAAQQAPAAAQIAQLAGQARGLSCLPQAMRWDSQMQCQQADLPH